MTVRHQDDFCQPVFVLFFLPKFTCYFIPFQTEVRLAEDYDVFISKAQLDSILVNYTRSGSLLFRKLVCILIFLEANSLVL